MRNFLESIQLPELEAVKLAGEPPECYSEEWIIWQNLVVDKAFEAGHRSALVMWLRRNGGMKWNGQKPPDRPPEKRRGEYQLGRMGIPESDFDEVFETIGLSPAHCMYRKDWFRKVVDIAASYGQPYTKALAAALENR